MKRKLTDFLFGTLLLMCFLINVQDGYGQAPTITAPADVTGLSDNCNVDYSNPTFTGTSSSSCTTGFSITFSDSSTACAISSSTSTGGSNILTRTWTITDCNGTASDAQIIEINDSTAPTLDHPVMVGSTASISLECVNSISDFQVMGLMPTVSDLCDQTAFPGIIPTIVSVSENGGTAVTTPPFALTTIGGCDATNGMNTYVIGWEAQDACGNVSATYMLTYEVLDITPPVISCPANIVVGCMSNLDPFVNTSLGLATAADNCTASFTTPNPTNAPMDGEIVYADDIMMPVPGDIITRTWTATDDCGNTSTCTQQITVSNDGASPTITCPADATIECGDPMMLMISMPPTTTDTGDATATDDCTMFMSSTQSPPTMGMLTYEDTDNQNADGIVGNCDDYAYTIMRTFTATDDQGNATSCTQMITIEDTTGPEVTPPADITIECSDVPLPTSGAMTGEPTATDDCDTAITPSFGTNAFYTDVFVATPSGTSTAAPCETGVISRTWFVTDACGNTGASTMIQTITLQDIGGDNAYNDYVTNTPTTTTSEMIDFGSGAVSVTSTVELRDTISCTEPVSPSFNIGLRVPTPDCGVDSSFVDMVSVCMNDPVLGNIYLIQRTWGGTNACGLAIAAADEIIQIIVVTSVPATFSGAPADITIDCSQDFNDLTVTGAAPTATGGCTGSIAPIITRSDVIGSSCTGGSFTIARTWTAYECGAVSATFTQNITVQDNTPPVVGVWPADITIACPTMPSDKLPFNTGYDQTATLASITDDCTSSFTSVDVVYTDNIISTGLTCPTTAVIQRSWSVADGCGNVSATYVQNITVEDSTPPTIDMSSSVPSNIVINCDDDPYDLTITGVAPTATDAACCVPSAAATVTYSDAISIPTGTCTTETDVTLGTVNNVIYKITRTFIASDACGNTTMLTPTQTVYITDNNLPVVDAAMFPPDVTIACGASISHGSTGTPVFTDDCGIKTLFYDDYDMPMPMGTSYYTMPQDISNITESEPVFTSCSPGSDFYRRWYAEDDCGNLSSIYEQKVTVIDNTPPSFTTFPSDLTINCGDNIFPFGVNNTGVPNANDFCDPAAASNITYSDVNTMGTGSCPDQIINRTFSVTDQCGNTNTALQVITIQDTQAPSISILADVTISCSVDINPNTNSAFMPTITDDCNTPTSSYIDVVTSGSAHCGVTTRTWTAVDACGASATMIQIITRDDTTNPTINMCPADYTVPVPAMGGCPTAADFDPSATGMPSATDNCDLTLTMTYVDAAGTCTAGTVTFTRTWTVSDDCGNSATCDQVIDYTDTDTPTFTCPADVTVNCTDSIDPAINTAIGIDITTIMDCDPNTNTMWTDISMSANTITRQWTVTDACGNAATCNQVITISSSGGPSIVCPNDVTISCGDSSAPGATNPTGFPTGVDCSGSSTNVSFTHVDANFVSGSCVSDYEFMRTWTATDGFGNTATCVQIITYMDNILPSFTSTPVDITIACGDASDSATLGIPTFTDNCSAQVTLVESDSAPDNCNSTFIRTFVITDGCGNSAFYNQNITVGTPTGIIITTCPANLTVECGMSTAPSATGMPSATTNCTSGGLTFTMSDVTTAGSCTGESIITRTWTYTDNCSNTNTCTQTINVVDNTPPTITCPTNITIACGASTATSNTGMATATDVCSVPTITMSDVGSGCGTTIMRTFTATDQCGNSSACTQMITVNSATTTSLNIICPSNATLSCGQSELPTNTGTASVSSNCPNGTNQPSYTDGATTCSGSSVSYMRTWTVTDGCGNSDVCTQMITINGVVGAAFLSPPADMNIACNTTLPSSYPPLNYSNNQTGSCMISGTGSAIIDDSGLNTSACTGCRVVTWNATDACGNNVSHVQNICYQNVNCPNNAVMTGFNNGSNSNNQTADDTEVNINITSNQTILASTSGVDYDAGVDIDFLPGFCVQLGAEFHAFIDGCGGMMIQDDEDNTVNGLNADEEGSTDTKENKNTPDIIQQEEE